MMLSFEQCQRATKRVTRAIALIGLTGLLLLASATVLDVLLRWLFNRPIVGLNDTYSLFTSLTIASCFPICIYNDGNITIRFLGKIFGSRVKDILDVFGSLLTLIIFAIMGWQLWLYAEQLAEDGATTWVLSWPVSPWWKAVTVIVSLCVPVTVVTIIRFAKAALKKNEAQEQPVPASTPSDKRNH